MCWLYVSWEKPNCGESAPKVEGLRHQGDGWYFIIAEVLG